MSSSSPFIRIEAKRAAVERFVQTIRATTAGASVAAFAVMNGALYIIAFGALWMLAAHYDQQNEQQRAQTKAASSWVASRAP